MSYIRAWTSLWHLYAVKKPVLYIQPDKDVYCKAARGANLITTSSKCSVRVIKKPKETIILWMLISMQWKGTIRGARYGQDTSRTALTSSLLGSAIGVHFPHRPLWHWPQRTPRDFLWGRKVKRWAGIWKAEWGLGSQKWGKTAGFNVGGQG